MKNTRILGRLARISPAVVLLGGLALAAASFASPASVMTKPSQATYTTTVNCQAAVKPCTLYPQGGTVPVVKTVINKITKTLLFDIQAQVHAEQQAVVRGVLRTAVMLSADEYLHTQYLDAMEESFITGQDGSGTAHITLQLDIPRLENYIERMEEETGITGSAYLVQIVPEVTGEVALGDSVFALQNMEPVVLRMEGGQMSLQTQSEAAAGAQTFPILDSKELSPAAVLQPVLLPLLGMMLPVATARWLSLALILLPLFFLAWEPAKKLLSRLRSLPEEEQIDRHNRSRIISIRGGDALQNKPTVELQSFQKLAAMAEQKDLPLFKLSGEESPAYLVIDTGMIYRYTAGAVAPQPHRLRKGGTAIESGAD